MEIYIGTDTHLYSLSGSRTSMNYVGVLPLHQKEVMKFLRRDEKCSLICQTNSDAEEGLQHGT